MSFSQTLLIVGLGNPGVRYKRTRHNIGFMVVDDIAESLGLFFKEEPRFHALVAKGQIGEVKVALMKPVTFMNASGEAVKKFLQFNRLPISQLVVISDDVALPFGSMRIRTQGSDGGHNGLKSITHHLGSNNYIRLRLGVGAERPQELPLADFVLAAFSEEEEDGMRKFIKSGSQAINQLLLDGATTAMNQVNQRTPKADVNGEEKK